MQKELWIYQRILPHYRVHFFERLNHSLEKKGIRLNVVYGNEFPGTVPKSEIVSMSWAIYRPNFYLKIFGSEVVLQQVLLRSLSRKSGIIIEQSNRLLINYALILLSKCSPVRIAFWGHGRNFQSKKPNGIKERLKTRMIRCVSWWFCYTDEGKRIVLENGFVNEKITVVQNSIDTWRLENKFNEITEHDLELKKKELGVKAINLGIFCGGMYEEKRISFLLRACDLVKRKVGSFEMLFIGDGPDAHLIEEFCRNRDWALFLGPIKSEERVKYFKLSKAQLMPGLVGLSVIDSFVLKTPLVTTDLRFHSPEKEFLKSGVNGIVSANSIDAFVEEIVILMTNKRKLERLRQGCSLSASKYSIENMVHNFSSGVECFLNR